MTQVARVMLTVTGVVASAAALAQPPASTVVTRFNPARLPFSETAALARLRVPQGYRVEVFAQGLTDPRMLVVASDGTVYVSRWRSGDVVALRDRDGDGRAEAPVELGRLPGAHGLELVEPFLAVATPREVYVTTVAAGRVLTPPIRLIADLPDGGQHANRVVRYGPDGLLYVSVGSSCNDCLEEDQRDRGTLIRYAPDGTRVDVFAKGLRNTIGFDWHPATGALWGLDNGNDFHGDDQPPEELNLLQAGRHYGWPNCVADRQVDALTNAPPGLQALVPGERTPVGLGITAAQFCAQTEPSVLTTTPHSAPIGFVFYRGTQFPGAQGDAFATLHGSWNRATPSGYKVVRVRYQQGTPVAIDDFVTGFLSDDGADIIGRPTGIAAAPDGTLFVSDDEAGVIYRVRYTG